MMSEAVITPSYDIRRLASIGSTIYGLDRCYDSADLGLMLSKGELLAALEAKGVKNKDVMRVLDMPSSRVSEIFRKEGKARDLTYDEGVKLAQAFLQESDQRVSPPPPQMLRLVVLHIARRLGVLPPEAQLDDLAEDLRAFSEYAADPKVRGSVEAAEGFFRAMEYLRPKPEEATRPESDPAPTH